MDRMDLEKEGLKLKPGKSKREAPERCHLKEGPPGRKAQEA
jgi:hypothetical protein